MIKKTVAIFCAVSFLGGGGCISFRIEPLPEPEQLVESFVLCKSVIPDGELLAPEETATNFNGSDPHVICFVGLTNVGRKMTLKWKWYSPDGKLYKETVEVPVNENDVYLEAVTAYDRLDIQQEESYKGRWLVVILVNGELAGRRTFTIL
ncbi:MAG: hypothetical protein PVH84_02545 [Candidatus Aminicenantes bacterium]|jgi:hypothetical protein